MSAASVAAALVTAALVAQHHLGDTSDGIGAVNSESAIDEDLDAVDDAD